MAKGIPTKRSAWWKHGKHRHIHQMLLQQAREKPKRQQQKLVSTVKELLQNG